MTATHPQTSTSAARHPHTRIDFTQEFEIDGCPYGVTVTTTPGVTDAVTVELVGMGSNGETTDGRFTVHTSALPHLGRVLTRTFDGLAALHGTAAPPRRERKKRRRPSKPNNSHQPWTADLDTQLMQAWQAARPTRTPTQIAADLARALDVPIADVRSQFQQPEDVHTPKQVVGAIAVLMQRTPVAITSRLKRLGLNPEPVEPELP